MIRAVLFDLDGTLLNTLQDLADAVEYALQQEGYPGHPLERYKYFVGNGVHNLLLCALPPADATDANAQALRKHFDFFYTRHCKDKTGPYDGIMNLLTRLQTRGIKTAVITNKFDSGAKALVADYFGGLIDSVYGQKEGVPIKPNPAQVCLAMQSLQVQPEECLFVGDSDVDMRTGKNAGNISVGVLWGFRTKAELEDSGAAYTVACPEEILRLIDLL